MQVNTVAQNQLVLTHTHTAPVLKKKRDYHLVLFFLNVAFVVIGYGIAHPTGFASVGPMKLIRILTLGISLYYLFNSRKGYHYIFKGYNSWMIWVFIALNMYVLPFSVDIFESFEKFVNLIPYFIYLNYFILYLYRVYDKEYALNFLLKVFNIIYLLPVISFILFGGGLNREDIYGEVVGGFVSNHYGWGCAIFLATSLDVIRNNPSITKQRKFLLIFCCLAAAYILAISGSRSGYLTFALCFILFIVKNRNVSLAIKILSTVATVGFVMHLYSDSDSILNRRIAKTETQLEKGDARSTLHNLGFNTLIAHPETLVTGLGFYVGKQGILQFNKNIDSQVFRINLHNSYYELLFGSGLFIFTFFAIFFVGKTLWNFTIYHSSRYTFLPPMLLIPFFENNFNPGQFLFFPWFTIMFFYIHYNERQIKIDSLPLETTTPIKRYAFL